MRRVGLPAVVLVASCASASGCGGGGEIGAARTRSVSDSGVLHTYTGHGINVPWGITAGPDGALWFTNRGSTVRPSFSIGRISTDGRIRTYYVSDALFLGGITAGPDRVERVGDRQKAPVEASSDWENGLVESGSLLWAVALAGAVIVVLLVIGAVKWLRGPRQGRPPRGWGS